MIKKKQNLKPYFDSIENKIENNRLAFVVKNNTIILSKFTFIFLLVMFIEPIVALLKINSGKNMFYFLPILLFIFFCFTVKDSKKIKKKIEKKYTDDFKKICKDYDLPITEEELDKLSKRYYDVIWSDYSELTNEVKIYYNIQSKEDLSLYDIYDSLFIFPDTNSFLEQEEIINSIEKTLKEDLEKIDKYIENNKLIEKYTKHKTIIKTMNLIVILSFFILLYCSIVLKKQINMAGGLLLVTTILTFVISGCLKYVYKQKFISEIYYISSSLMIPRDNIYLTSERFFDTITGEEIVKSNVKNHFRLNDVRKISFLQTYISLDLYPDKYDFFVIPSDSDGD